MVLNGANTPEELAEVRAKIKHGTSTKSVKELFEERRLRHHFSLEIGRLAVVVTDSPPTATPPSTPAATSSAKW